MFSSVTFIEAEISEPKNCNLTQTQGCHIWAQSGSQKKDTRKDLRER